MFKNTKMPLISHKYCSSVKGQEAWGARELLKILLEKRYGYK